MPSEDASLRKSDGYINDCHHVARYYYEMVDLCIEETRAIRTDSPLIRDLVKRWKLFELKMCGYYEAALDCDPQDDMGFDDLP